MNQSYSSGTSSRKLYFECSNKNGCVTIEGDELNVDNVCGKKCFEKAISKSGLNIKEMKRI